jgi:hypothetical protein
MSSPPRIECKRRASQDLTRAQVGVGGQRSSIEVGRRAQRYEERPGYSGDL